MSTRAYSAADLGDWRFVGVHWLLCALWGVLLSVAGSHAACCCPGVQRERARCHLPRVCAWSASCGWRCAGGGWCVGRLSGQAVLPEPFAGASGLAFDRLLPVKVCGDGICR